jgi:hypothetical protein
MNLWAKSLVKATAQDAREDERQRLRKGVGLPQIKFNISFHHFIL